MKTLSFVHNVAMFVKNGRRKMRKEYSAIIDKQEDLIGIETIDKLSGVVGDGMIGSRIIKEMFVPRHLIELAICNEKRILPMPLDVQIRTAWIGDEENEIKCPCND